MNDILRNLDLEMLKSLEEGHKVTIVKFGCFGFAEAIQTKIYEIKERQHYEGATDKDLVITHKAKGKRHISEDTTAYNLPLLVFDGWTNIDADTLQYEQIEKGTKKSKYTAFNNQIFNDIICSCGIEPLVEMNC